MKVGQKVICIATFTGGYGDEIDPVVGGIYTIRRIVNRSHHKCPLGLWLEEIRNEPREYFLVGTVECSFPADKFRPLIERSTETGMAILQKIARDTKLPVDA